MIASSQVKHPRAVSLGPQRLTCTYPPTFWYPYTHLCDILPTGFVHRHQVIATGLDLLLYIYVCLDYVSSVCTDTMEQGMVVSFQVVVGPWIHLEKCYPGLNLVICRASTPRRGC